MIWCFREHWPRGPMRHRPGDWLICAIVSSGGMLLDLLLASGLLCADTDGGLLYWRARFWRPAFHRHWVWANILNRVQAVD